MNYARAIDEVFSGYTGPRFSIRWWNGTERVYGTQGVPTFTLVVADERTARRLLAHGALGFGETYMEGGLRVEGDLASYLRLRHQFKHVRRSPRLILAILLARWSTPHSRAARIAQHYDLGNEFFQKILDRETMSYSAGRYETGSETLAAAQQKKLSLVCQWLGLPAGASVLDLGSGWGGFARFAASAKQWHVTGYTLSNAQLEYAQKLVAPEPSRAMVSFAYQDMIGKLPPVRYDGIAMVESIEHVGKERLPRFFGRLAQLLKPGSPLVIQCTGRYQPHALDPWTLKYVFPGGYLPAKGELVSGATNAGFSLEKFRDDTPDYLHTMTAWIENLERHRADIERVYGQPLYRLWELWMHGAKVAFEVGAMNLFRMRLKRMA